MGREILIVKSRHKLKETPLSSEHSAKVRETQHRYRLILNICIINLDTIAKNPDSQKGGGGGGEKNRLQVHLPFNFPHYFAGYLSI